MTLDDFLREWNGPCEWTEIHTSGSTGQPKLIRVEKQRMKESARITCNFLGLEKGNTALLCLPLEYIAGKMMVVRSVERGLKLHCVPPTSHPLLSDSLPQQIDLCAMVPLQVSHSLESVEERKRLNGIRHLLIGGGSIHPSLEVQLRTMPNHIWSTYGMTETLSHIALRKINGSDASLWYRPFDGVTVELNPQGCLSIHAPNICPEVLHTNDRAELRQKDGHTEFRILGRIDNVIASGGIKIQMEEVENLLTPHLHHPFMITKCSDASLGETVVMLTESHSIDKIETICRNVLPRHWQPRKFIIVKNIPTTPNGKPARAEALKIAQKSANT